MAEEIINNPTPDVGIDNGAEGGTGAEPAEKTFTQAEVDALISKRLDRERKKFPTDDEIGKYREWLKNQETEQDTIQRLTQELDDAKGELVNTQLKLQKAANQRYIESKGFTGEDAEFVLWKATKAVNETTTFEQAVDEIAAARKAKQQTFDWGASVSGAKSQPTGHDAMNALIRSAFKT